MAKMGWDTITIDLQHGLNDFSTSIAMLQAISNSSTIPFARVPWNEPGIIMRMLDLGVIGIIAPMINSKKECEDFDLDKIAVIIIRIVAIPVVVNCARKNSGK